MTNAGVSLDQTIVVDQNVVSRELDGEMVILHLGTGQYFGLDAIGTRAWALAVERRKLREIVDVMLNEYDVTERVLSADLVTLFSEMQQQRLVNVS